MAASVMPQIPPFVTVDSCFAEHEKFAAPVILLHGLWTTSGIWRGLMGCLAHRGWTCHALHLPRLGAIDWTVWLDLVGRLLRELEVKPVLIGHDVGATLALGQVDACATVALAPVTRPDLAGIVSWRRRLQAGLGWPVSPPSGRERERYLGSSVAGGVVAEAPGVIRSLPGELVAVLPTRRPVLVAVGRDDMVTPRQALAQIELPATVEVRSVDGGHALPWSSRAEILASEIHRWLVQQLGERLLLLHEDDD